MIEPGSHLERVSGWVRRRPPSPLATLLSLGLLSLAVVSGGGAASPGLRLVASVAIWVSPTGNDATSGLWAGARVWPPADATNAAERNTTTARRIIGSSGLAVRVPCTNVFPINPPVGRVVTPSPDSHASHTVPRQGGRA